MSVPGGDVSVPARYRDRRDAGRVLASWLERLDLPAGCVVLGLPRGGVPVAAEIAARLAVPLDVLVVRKLGLPGHPELAMGAIAGGGIRVLNDDIVRQFGATPAEIDAVTQAELVELTRRERAYRGARPPVPLAGRTVVLVDDGLATGATMHAAVNVVRAAGPREVIVAAPVGARETCAALAAVADRVVCPLVPQWFAAVGEWYDDFRQTTDNEVERCLA